MTRLILYSLPLCLALFSPGLLATEIIVHRAVPEPDLTLNSLRLVFTMRLLRWRDGARVKVFVLSDAHPLHREFAKQSLGLYPRQLRRVWDRNRYSGFGPVPVEASSIEEMARLVATTPGAIGYLPTGHAGASVRVIHVK